MSATKYDDRAERALTDVVAVENIAPGMVRVVTWSDAYPVDARDAGCNCPDKEYRDVPVCKHEYAALLADTDKPAPFVVSDDLQRRPVTDGGDRPEECDCSPTETDLSCWPCRKAGFDTNRYEEKEV